MNSRATSLPKPAYPQTAKQVNAAGQVTVQIMVDEEGNVTSARALNGHPLLRAPAENAARQSRFNPVRVGDQAVRATGVLVYNFINQ
jgi:TonB family protein